jgi:fused signal recognition particle receptor
MLDGLREKLGCFKNDVYKAVGEKEIREKDVDKPLRDLELSLLESDVALSVAEEIVSSTKEKLIGSRKGILERTDEIVEEALKDAILAIISNSFDFDSYVEKAKRPTKIVFVGVNGTGKTTSIAKIVHRLLQREYSVVIASGDTFRAGAMEQLGEHADRLGVKLIKHPRGGDPAAVVYDAVSYATARHEDFVLVDTAGRTHTNVNLMDQLAKICRVTEPDLVLFVDEAIAGNDAVERAKRFERVLDVDGTILTKLDADAKGGTAISLAYTTGKPILFVGTGQRYEDLKKFDPDWFIERLFEP